MGLGSVSLTVDITASGENGLDTGSEEASKWYHIWTYVNTSKALKGILSLSSTAPTLPEGCTRKLYLGAVYNNASSNFVSFNQFNNYVGIPFTAALAGGTQTSITSVNLFAIVPVTAKLADAISMAYMGTTQAIATIYSDSAGTVKAMQPDIYASTGGTVMVRQVGIILLLTAQTIYYKCYASSGSAYIHIRGWYY
jgi:hypothetical protein